MYIPEIKQKNQKQLLVLKIIGFQLGKANSHNPEQDICHWQSSCYETPLRFNILLREQFSRSRSPRVIKKYDESPLIQILQEFGTI